MTTLLERADSAVRWGRALSFLVPYSTTLTVLNRVMGADRIQPMNRLLCIGMLKTVGVKWRSEVHPAVRDDESYVFAQNHINHLDFITMHNATPHFKQGVELETHFRYPFYGWFMSSRGTIPVPADKTKRTDAVREGMREEIARHHSILAFPEGTRTLDGTVGPFRTGIFFIARDLGLKVVPTAVTGMFEVMRKGSYLLRGGDVCVYCDEPVDFAGRNDDEVREGAEAVRSAIVARVEAHRAKVEGTR
ncbi:MAG: lysophospholipid acyltransferase family protein [Myxococcota bacterium]